ncbi:MAG: hypothetical protein ACK4RV_10390 [Caulobacter sp.]
MKVAITALIASLVAAPALAADQFDLLCTGTVKWRATGAAEPWSSRYRVDLAAKIWCQGECTETRPLVSADNSRIVFVERDAPGQRRDLEWHRVSRTTGKLTHYVSSGSLYMDVEANCEPAAFSGMPRAKF